MNEQSIPAKPAAASVMNLRVDYGAIEALTGADAPLWAPVHFDLGGVAFPAAGWTDFVGSVVGSTAVALERLQTGKRDGFTYFFDGPYYIGYRRTSPRSPLTYVEANVDREKIKTSWSGYVDLDELVGGFKTVVDRMIDECGRRNITGAGHLALHRSRFW